MNSFIGSYEKNQKACNDINTSYGQSGQLEPGDASALRAAGFEQQAQQCERLRQMQQDQRLADQALASRENYQQARAQSAAWSEMGLLERLGHAPLTQDQIAANRERYGVTGK